MELTGDEFEEEAHNTIHALVGLVAAAERRSTVHVTGPAQRDYQFDGMERCPSFAIITKGSEINIVINPRLWLFDGADELGEELFHEILDPLKQFQHRRLDEPTVHAMASTMRGKMEALVDEDRITRRP